MVEHRSACVNLYNEKDRIVFVKKTRKCANKPRQKSFSNKSIIGTPQQQQQRRTIIIIIIISHYCFSLLLFLGATSVTALPGCFTFVWHHHILPLGMFSSRRNSRNTLLLSQLFLLYLLVNSK